MEFSVENICGFLIRSKLMTPDEMRAMYQRWKSERKESASVQQFARWLIANKYVTEYQAALLLKGHTEGYFLNQYRILERVGRGRMAGVYRALHPLGQTVAVKVLPPSRAKHAQTMGRFRREAELSMRLKHPNVVRSFQVGLAGDLHYLVMEYLEGETLEEVLQRRKRLPPAEAVRIVHQALQGLQHIHEQSMVHRDLKPSNLMLTPLPAAGAPDTTLAATVKILDIGLGRQLFDENQPNVFDQADLTAEGTLLGTPDYLAPEQARDPRNIDIRADIYSLGCVLYHALTGQPPFPDKNILNQMVRHATEKPRPLREFNPQVPDGLQQIIDWMMAKKPDERYPTPERAAQALGMFLLVDSTPPQRLEDAPQMRSFLTWLETGNNSEAATVDVPSEASSNAERAAPQPASQPELPAAITEDLAAVAVAAAPPARDNHKRKRAKTDEIPVVAAPAVPAEAEVEAVELVAVAAPHVSSASARPWLNLSQRDWLLLGLGSGTALFLMLVVLVLVIAFRS